ncbi:MAG: GWxTD domain-containing protein [Bacteroidia bacterium]
MKKLTFSGILLLLMIVSSAQGKNLKALMAYKTFYNSEKGPYIETYLSVAGSSVKYSKLGNGKYQGKIEISLSFNLNGETKHYDKYNLLSPEVDDTVTFAFNFIDQQRIPLNNGKYLMEISIADKNAGTKPFSSKQEINIEYYPNIASVSDVELVDSYKKSEGESMLTKNGYEIIPYVNNFYPDDMNTLKFYAEIYNVKKVSDEPVLINYFIQSLETKRVIEKFHGFKKEEPQNLNVLLTEFSIEDLISGNYTLVVEIRNKKNELLAFKDVSFQRSKKGSAFSLSGAGETGLTFTSSYTNKDTLADYIKSLRPISNANETTFEDTQVKIADVRMMQNFLFDFWAKREPDNPAQGWLTYNEQVKKVNAEYSSLNKRGYETDRGRVYLQYGPPNTIQKEYRESSAYPYELWHYYTIANQSNRKFVYYNPDLVSNDFILLHSDASGEVHDNQWELKLRKRDTQTRDLDQEPNMDNFGNRSNQNFTNPR